MLVDKMSVINNLPDEVHLSVGDICVFVHDVGGHLGGVALIVISLSAFCF